MLADSPLPSWGHEGTTFDVVTRRCVQHVSFWDMHHVERSCQCHWCSKLLQYVVQFVVEERSCSCIYVAPGTIPYKCRSYADVQAVAFRVLR